MLDKNYSGENMVFIVGCPRSGTTYLQRLLASHSKIKTGQESDLFDIYLGPQLRDWNRDKNPAINGRTAIGLGCYLTEKEYLDLLRDFMIKLLDKMLPPLDSDEYFIEKTPSHALFLPEIMQLLPNAKIIHLIRNPYDVASSLINAANTWGGIWAPKTSIKAINMWRRHIEAVDNSRKLIPESQFLEINYKHLISKPEETLQHILGKFLKISTKKEELFQIVQNNTKEAMLAGKGGKIPIKGFYGELLLEKELKEPNGFVTRDKDKRKVLSFLDRLVINYKSKRYTDRFK